MGIAWTVAIGAAILAGIFFKHGMIWEGFTSLAFTGVCVLIALS